jgi:hypothetical protein
MEILKLVREFVCDSTKAVMEDIDGKKSWAIEGIGIQMGIKNANERIYVPEPMLEQLQDHYKNYMLQNRAVGELNHPDEPKDQIRINPERISHKFTEMKIDGNNVYLKAKPVAGNKCGDVVINLLNAEIKLGFSSRALAKLIKKSDYTETHCRKIISLSDVVWDPSAPDAMITSVLEGKDWVYENGVIMEATGFEEVVESVKDQFKKMNKYNKNQVVIKAFKEYFGALLKK